MRTPMSEQETIIRWYRDEEEATIYTSDLTMMTRFDKFVESGDWELDTENYSGQDIVSKEYKAPKKLVYGKPKKANRKPLTEEERDALRAQFQANMSAQKPKNSD